MSPPLPPVSPEVLDPVLRRGDLEVEGRLVDASNATLKCVASLDGVEVSCVYKPRRGERPLWDFPTGTLGEREVAAYEVSAASGWDLVPVTVWREEGRFGPGMCQAWVDVDERSALVDVVPRAAVPPGWRDVVDAEGPGGAPVSLVHADNGDLRRLAVLDAVINNADRKGGHVLVGTDGRTYGIDHGVTFHDEPKLRTVLWGWAGEPLGDELEGDLERLLDLLDGSLGTELAGLLSRAEVRATVDRAHRLHARAVFPYPGEGWPSLPWPAF
ncbi:MAG: SCO1664 family protein [Candidatus Nanopelagicales bacterium]